MPISLPRIDKAASLIQHAKGIVVPTDAGPRCIHYGSYLRPDVVWRNTLMEPWRNVMLALRECDVTLVIGASLEVYPAAGTPDM